MRYELAKTIPSGSIASTWFREAVRGISVDDAGALYVVGDKRVIILEPSGEMRTSWSTEVEGLCVATDAKGQVYVGARGRIDVFDKKGGLVKSWRDAERLGIVTQIAFYDGWVLVGDVTGRCIRRFDESGTWKNDIGTGGRLRGFFIPNGHVDFAVQADGIIRACNPAKHRVERYTLDGELLDHFGKWGGRHVEDFPGCCNPTNLALGPTGHVVVTEKAPPRMKVYDDAGRLLAHVGSDLFDPNCKNMDVAVGREGRIYVVDTARLRVLQFEPREVESPGSVDSTKDLIEPTPAGGVTP